MIKKQLVRMEQIKSERSWNYIAFQNCQSITIATTSKMGT